MDKKLQEIINKSTFEIQEGRFVYAKVRTLPEINKHFMISQDKDEITVITREDNLGDLDLIEKNKEFYKLIALNVAVPFYSVGFLATVSGAIAKERMNILIVSTYSKNYIMVKEDCLDKAKKSLVEARF